MHRKEREREKRKGKERRKEMREGGRKEEGRKRKEKSVTWSLKSKDFIHLPIFRYYTSSFISIPQKIKRIS